MEELFLSHFLAGYKLDIVYQQEIAVAVFVMKLGGVLLGDRTHKLVGEILTGGVDDVEVGMIFSYLVFYRF